MSDTKQKYKQFIYNLCSAYISSGIGAAVVFPLDTIRVRIQNYHIIPSNNNITNINTTGYKIFKQLILNEGISALYKGLTPKILTTGLEKTIKINTFNYVSNLLKSSNCPDCKNHVRADIYAGFIAGGVQSLVISPAENLSIQMQINKSNKGMHRMTLFEAFQQIGFKRLYNGVNMCFMRDAPFSAIYFASMNYISQYLKQFEQHINNMQIALISGSLAAIPSAFIVTPCDVIKTRIQASNNTNIPIFNHIDTIYNEYGVKGFFRGGLFRIIRSTPQFGITMYILAFLNK